LIRISIINGFHNYPPDRFPTYWKVFEEFIADEKFFFHESVWDELQKHEDEKSRWLRKTVPTALKLSKDNDEIRSYAVVTNWARNERIPRYKSEAVRDFLGVADSWLVACAYARSLCIVSNATSNPRKITKVKLPDAAAALDVDCITGIDFLRREKISF